MKGISSIANVINDCCVRPMSTIQRRGLLEFTSRRLQLS